MAENDEGSMSYKIVTEIATREGVNPAELNPRLYEAVDCETLNQLCCPDSIERGRVPTHIGFRYHGYHISITDGQEISIDDQSNSASAPL